MLKAQCVLTCSSRSSLCYGVNVMIKGTPPEKMSSFGHCPKYLPIMIINVYAAYLTILMISFCHENLKTGLIFWKVLYCRSGWVGSAA